MMSNKDHLYQETNNLPLKEQTKMLMALKCFHPNQDLTLQLPTPRNIEKQRAIGTTKSRIFSQDLTHTEDLAEEQIWLTPTS